MNVYAAAYIGVGTHSCIPTYTYRTPHIITYYYIIMYNNNNNNRIMMQGVVYLQRYCTCFLSVVSCCNDACCTYC